MKNEGIYCWKYGKVKDLWIAFVVLVGFQIGTDKFGSDFESHFSMVLHFETEIINFASEIVSLSLFDHSFYILKLEMSEIVKFGADLQSLGLETDND